MIHCRLFRIHRAKRSLKHMFRWLTYNATTYHSWDNRGQMGLPKFSIFVLIWSRLRKDACAKFHTDRLLLCREVLNWTEKTGKSTVHGTTSGPPGIAHILTVFPPLMKRSTGASNARGYDELPIFSQISRCIAETVILRWAHAARQFVSIGFSFHPCNILRDNRRYVSRANKNVGCGTWKQAILQLL